MSTVTFTSSPAKARRGSTATADAVIASAVDVAREAAVDAAGPDGVGEHQGVRAEGHRVATHYFASTSPGYRGWRWAVTLARAPRAKTATVCEVALLAGEGAIVAPEWLPWSERLQPGDLGREDVLPYSADDHRLMPGYAAVGDEEADRLALYELGLGRPRVLSPEGRDEAATRWYSGVHGPVRGLGAVRGQGEARTARVAAQCSTCGFLMLMAGSMRQTFGVCSNEWSPDDGQVVSMDHGCGAHSETDVAFDSRRDWPDPAPVVDDAALEVFEHRRRRGEAPAETATPADAPASTGAPRGEDAAMPADTATRADLAAPADTAVPGDTAPHAEDALPGDTAETGTGGEPERPSEET